MLSLNGYLMFLTEKIQCVGIPGMNIVIWNFVGQTFLKVNIECRDFYRNIIQLS